MKDVEKVGSAPLPDNDPEHKYIYEITVMTGTKRNASTRSSIHFILTGEEGETDIRALKDGHRDAFAKGAISSFVMTVPRYIIQILQVYMQKRFKN